MLTFVSVQSNYEYFLSVNSQEKNCENISWVPDTFHIESRWLSGSRNIKRHCYIFADWPQKKINIAWQFCFASFSPETWFRKHSLELITINHNSLAWKALKYYTNYRIESSLILNSKQNYIIENIVRQQSNKTSKYSRMSLFTYTCNIYFLLD